jgi:small subunit ribosomal protein S1
MTNEINEGGTMADFEQEITDSFQSVEEGEIITGTVITVTEEEVTLDLKYYAEGIIKLEDFSREPGFSIKDEVQVGDEVTATVIRKDDGHGNILLSKVAATDVLAWDKLMQLKKDQTILDVVVKGVVNAGVIAYVEGVRGFIPASKLSLSYVENLEDFLNKPLQVQVVDVIPGDKRLILSARELLKAKADEQRKQKISNVEVGLITEGTVESLQSYGAFVNLGSGLSGLVHVSQISEKRIKSPASVLNVGDQVKVKVIAIKDGKLSLSMKALNDLAAERIEEETYDLPNSNGLTTNLGSLFKNIKL